MISRATKGSDIFALAMEAEGMDFRRAMEFLARKAGVDLSEYQSWCKKAHRLQKAAVGSQRASQHDISNRVYCRQQAIECV